MWNPKKVTKPKVVKTQKSKPSKAQKIRAGIKQANLTTQLANARTQQYGAQTAENLALNQRNKSSKAGRFLHKITTPFRNIGEVMAERHKTRIAKEQAKQELAKSKPDLYREQVQTENELKKTKARTKGKMVSSLALAKGASTLGKGLSDENNQDDRADREARQKQLETIFNNNTSSKGEEGSSYGLTEGKF